MNKFIFACPEVYHHEGTITYFWAALGVTAIATRKRVVRDMEMTAKFHLQAAQALQELDEFERQLYAGMLAEIGDYTTEIDTVMREGL